MSCTPKICITIYNFKKQSNSSFQYFYHKTKTQNSYSYQDTNWSKLCVKLQPLITHNKHQQKDQHPHQLSHSNQNPIKKKQTLKLKDPNHCKKEKKTNIETNKMTKKQKNNLGLLQSARHRSHAERSGSSCNRSHWKWREEWGRARGLRLRES